MGQSCSNCRKYGKCPLTDNDIMVEDNLFKFVNYGKHCDQFEEIG